MASVPDPSSVLQTSDRVALKDDKLVYRACSAAFACGLGRGSPEEIVGRTDFELMPAHVAREQLTLDSQAIYTAKADISAIELGGEQAMILRTPVMGPGDQVRGLDIRLLNAAPVTAPRQAVTVDYQTLVNDGIQGSLIFSRKGILFANDNAATALGFRTARSLIEQGELASLLGDVELQRIARAAQRSEDASPNRRLALRAVTSDGKSLTLVARVALVQWGAVEATLLSFVDVALPSPVIRLPQGPLSTPVPLREPAALARISPEPVSAPESGSYSAAVATGTRTPAARNTESQAAEGQVAEAQAAPLRRLQVREERFRHFASAAADFFWETDRQRRFRFLSSKAESVLGLPVERVVGRTLEQLLGFPANVNPEGYFNEHLGVLREHQPFREFEFRWSVRGETRVVRYSGLPVFNTRREFLGYRGTGCDVTSSVRQAEAVAYHANHDALTGLVNRRHFEHQVAQGLELARTQRQSHALCFLDLDNFKIVNDTCGHQAGDELLRQLAQLFDSLVRKSDLLARLGGDEFGVFLINCSVAEALKLANQIRHEVKNFDFLWNENRFNVGVSIGLVVADDRWESCRSLFSAADSACYIAKNEGRNRVVVYREGDGYASNRKVETHWVEEINSALENDRLKLACQKILPLHDQPDGMRYEMLLRLQMPDGKLVNPQSFLPTAERYGLSSQLDDRAIDMTLAWLRANPSLLMRIRHVAINLSSQSIADEAFAHRLIARIQASGIAPEKLCFEMTETSTIANLTSASNFMRRLDRMGCRFGIDDFGSGLSSFAYLRKLPVEFLKIDGQLVKDILDDPTDYTMVKAINEISKSLGKRTVAEHIETPRLLHAVRDIGIDFAQGFYIGEPELIRMPAVVA